MADRAWPFPHGRPEDGFDARQCVRMYGRTKSCGADWAERQRLSAGLFFGVALTVFMTKVRVIAASLTSMWSCSFYIKMFLLIRCATGLCDCNAVKPLEPVF